jgi:hypothetical protein
MTSPPPVTSRHRNEPSGGPKCGEAPIGRLGLGLLSFSLVYLMKGRRANRGCVCDHRAVRRSCLSLLLSPVTIVHELTSLVFLDFLLQGRAAFTSHHT